MEELVHAVVTDKPSDHSPNAERPFHAQKPIDLLYFWGHCNWTSTGALVFFTSESKKSVTHMSVKTSVGTASAIVNFIFLKFCCSSRVLPSVCLLSEEHSEDYCLKD
jgi:hypothetical protein